MKTILTLLLAYAVSVLTMYLFSLSFGLETSFSSLFVGPFVAIFFVVTLGYIKNKNKKKVL